MSAGTESNILAEESHTPGPWHVGVGGNFHGNRIWTSGMRPVVNLCSMGTAPADLDPEAQANGKLIAAAPDLLELVRQYASECSECGGTGRPGSFQDNVPGDITKGVHEVEIDCPDCRDIRDIIAKATGVS